MSFVLPIRRGQSVVIYLRFQVWKLPLPSGLYLSSSTDYFFFTPSEVAAFLPAEVSFCVASHIPRQFFRFWIPMIAFEFFLCVLALFHGFRTSRSEDSVLGDGRSIVTILIRDSVLYFQVYVPIRFTHPFILALTSFSYVVFSLLT